MSKLKIWVLSAILLVATIGYAQPDQKTELFTTKAKPQIERGPGGGEGGGDPTTPTGSGCFTLSIAALFYLAAKRKH